MLKHLLFGTLVAFGLAAHAAEQSTAWVVPSDDLPKPDADGGYQADFDAQGGFDGSFYNEAGVAGNRGTMSNRGDKTIWDTGNKRHSERLEEGSADLQKLVRIGGWNELPLVAKGNHVIYSINGHVMTDGSPDALNDGLLALQLHAGFTMEVQFKDIKIKVANEKKRK
jgi:hypothetical protein